MSKPNNPPAFPIYEQPREEMSLNCANAGMTLRDYFAAQVLAALVISGLAKLWPDAAQNAYNAADAMLEERGKQ